MARRYLVRWLFAAVLASTLIYLAGVRSKASVTRSLQRLADQSSKIPILPLVDVRLRARCHNAAQKLRNDQAFPTYRPRAPSHGAGWLPFPTTNHSRAVIVAHMQEEDIGWVYRFLSHDKQLQRIHYTVDDPHASYKVPMNKGHEAMPYLTYIITHYDRLPDVSIFLHAHQFAWHNNDLLDSDAVNMVTRLSSPKVVRDGYFNLRCHRDPGCPAHLHPALQLEPDSTKPEQEYIGQAWRELFPGTPPPVDLSAPCCAQFAVSKERLLSLPLARYEQLRQWLIDTRIPDHISGRIFEYIWHVLWTGRPELCPDELVCHCDAYGVCMESTDDIREWQLMRFELRANAEKMTAWMIATRHDEHAREQAAPQVAALRERNKWLHAEMVYRQQESWELGHDPHVRAYVAGRPWSEGDGI